MESSPSKDKRTRDGDNNNLMSPSKKQKSMSNELKDKLDIFLRVEVETTSEQVSRVTSLNF